MSELIKEMNIANKNMEKEKLLPYKTLPRRIFAGMIDASIYTVFSIIILLICLPFNSPFADVILWSIMIPLNVVYVVVTTKVWGGTIGKLYFNLSVLNNKDEGSITWRQSFFREIINTVISLEYLVVPYAFIVINNYFKYSDYLTFSANNIVFKVIDYLFLCVFLIEAITAATNNKRRSVHDFIGGTIVKTHGGYRRFSNYIAIISVVIVYIFYFRLFDYVVLKGN